MLLALFKWIFILIFGYLSWFFQHIIWRDVKRNSGRESTSHSAAYISDDDTGIGPFDERSWCVSSVENVVIYSDGRVENNDESDALFLDVVHQLRQLGEIYRVDGEVSSAIHVVDIRVLDVLLFKKKKIHLIFNAITVICLIGQFD